MTPCFIRFNAHFQKAGWHIETGNSDLPEDENGIRVVGGKDFDREMAKWGLNAIGLKWSDGYRPVAPEMLEVIVGRYDLTSKTKVDGPNVKALRALERVLHIAFKF